MITLPQFLSASPTSKPSIAPSKHQPRFGTENPDQTEENVPALLRDELLRKGAWDGGKTAGFLIAFGFAMLFGFKAMLTYMAREIHQDRLNVQTFNQKLKDTLNEKGINPKVEANNL